MLNKHVDVREGVVAAINGGMIIANELMDKPVKGKKERGLATTPAGEKECLAADCEKMTIFPLLKKSK